MKNTYITWHYTTHGVAYLKHILSEFNLLMELPEKIKLEGLNQEQLNSVFDSPKRDHFLFDEIIYLTARQEAFDGISSRRFTHRNRVFEDPLIKELGLTKVYKDLFKEFPENNLEEETEYVKKHFKKEFKKFVGTLWRDIQHYPVDQQVKWLLEYSNFKNVYLDRFKVVELNVDDLRSEKQISEEVSKWIRQYLSRQKNSQNIINVSLGSNETQVVWHILAEAGQLPENTRFIKTYDDKADLKNHFKHFSIQEIPTNLISSIGTEFKIYDATKSLSRELVNKKMQTFLKSGFTILLIGERGTGKSQIASEAKKSFDQKSPFIEANCASFDEDSKAEAELFGYEKGAFTGANTTKKGLIEEADGGILFLDEVHHLSKLVQAKLMKALQTDENNRMSIRRMGGKNEIKVECRIIFATNKNVAELRNELLPDFYDRIVQHVVNIPALRETVEDRVSDWKNIWYALKLKGKDKSGNIVWLKTPPDDVSRDSWLKSLPLYGNYRDLQKIAMYYNAFNQFDDETKKMLSEKTAFNYAKNEFEKYHSPVIQLESEKYNFNIRQTTKEMIADYQFALQDWAVNKFHTRKAAIEHFQSLGDSVVEETFYSWKTKKALKK